MGRTGCIGVRQTKTACARDASQSGRSFELLHRWPADASQLSYAVGRRVEGIIHSSISSVEVTTSKEFERLGWV